MAILTCIDSHGPGEQLGGRVDRGRERGASVPPLSLYGRSKKEKKAKMGKECASKAFSTPRSSQWPPKKPLGDTNRRVAEQRTTNKEHGVFFLMTGRRF